MRKHTLMRAAATLAAAALALTGCSGSSNDKPEETSKPAAEKTDTESTSESNSEGEGTTDAEGWSVTDVDGRTVTLDKAPERVVLAESRSVFVTAFLNKENPIDKVVGWGTDLHSGAPDFEDQLFKAFPAAKDIPSIGHVSHGDVEIETLISLKPDVIVFTLGHKKALEKNGMLPKFDEAGLKYVFTDFRDKPVTNTVPSVEIIGKIFGHEDKAKEFAAFYNERLDKIKDAVAKQDKKTSAFLWRAAGLKDCCATFGNNNLGEMLIFAGADNIAVELLGDAPKGDLTVEKVLQAQPEVIIATGGQWSEYEDSSGNKSVNHAHIGYGYDTDEAASTLANLITATPGSEAWKAPQEKKLYGIWHQFYDSPYNIFAMEAMAKWLNPDAFSDVDPAADFAQFHEEWMPFKADGTFFVGVK